MANALLDAIQVPPLSLADELDATMSPGALRIREQVEAAQRAAAERARRLQGARGPMAPRDRTPIPPPAFPLPEDVASVPVGGGLVQPPAAPDTSPPPGRGMSYPNLGPNVVYSLPPPGTRGSTPEDQGPANVPGIGRKTDYQPFLAPVPVVGGPGLTFPQMKQPAVPSPAEALMAQVREALPMMPSDWATHINTLDRSTGATVPLSTTRYFPDRPSETTFFPPPGGTAGGAPGYPSLDQLMAQAGVRPLGPSYAFTPGAVADLAREDKARGDALQLYGQMLQAQAHEKAAKLQAEAHVAAQRPDHTRILENLVGGEIAAGREVSPQKLAEWYRAIQAVTPHLGTPGGASAPGPAGPQEPLVKARFSRPEELEALIAGFHRPNDSLEAKKLGEALQSNQLLRENLPDLMSALKRRTIVGGMPTVQRDVANEVVRLAQAGGLTPNLEDARGDQPVKLPNNWELVFGKVPTLRGPGFEVPLGTSFTDKWRRSNLTPTFPSNVPLYRERIGPLLQFLEASRAEQP